MARFIRRVHDSEQLAHVPGPEQLRWLSEQDGFDPATDGLIAVGEDGEVRAEAGAWSHLTEDGSRVFIWADVDPDFTDLRPFLIRWGEARARQVLEGISNETPRVIRSAVEEHRRHLRECLEGAGFEAARSFVVMRRSLDHLPEPPPLPGGVRVEPWSTDIDDGIREVNNEAFADHWGSLPMNREMWDALYRDSKMFRRDASFAALEGDEVVSFVLTEFDEEDVETRGFVEFYIHRVGTRRAHRRKRIASHLLVRALAAAKEAGADTAALDVDESSHTGATEVYSRLGFEVVERSIHYLKTL